MALDLEDRWGVSKHLLKHGDYDPELTKVAKKLCPPGAIALDVGANIGYWTTFLAKVCQCRSIKSFEPHPANLKLLKMNVALNGIENQVEIIAKGLSSQAGAEKLYQSDDNSGDHQLYSSPGREYIEVETENFDLSYPNTAIDFIKIDTQGYEGHVLKGLEQTLKNNQGVKIIMEFWPHGLKAAGSDPRLVVDQLRSLGFLLWAVVPNSTEIRKVDTNSVMSLCEGEVHTDLISSRTTLSI